MPSDETHEQTYYKGLEVRRAVLGADHVDRSLAQVSDFARPDAGARHRVLLGRRVDVVTGLTQDPEPGQPGHADGAQPARTSSVSTYAAR